MGNLLYKQTSFTEQQLDAYQDCTFLTRKEILRIYHRFRELAPDEVPDDMSGSEPFTFKLPRMALEHMTEFKENPFRRRVCEVFSEDGSGDMSFNDFLDMFSIFSEEAPRDIKAHFAFKIYDFDDDDYLDRDDLTRTINCITRNDLSNDEIKFICDKVFEEADLDHDDKLSFSEFEYVISRAPDFVGNFHVRI